jgi:acid phosphatase
MSINRRRVLIGAGAAGLGMVVGAKVLSDILKHRSIAAVPTIPTPTSKLLKRFAVIGDTGSGDRNQYGVAQALVRYHDRTPFDTVLMVGDNIYNNGEFSKIGEVFVIPYQELLKRGVKFYASLGNHDVRSENGDREVAYPQFNMQGKRYYTHGQGDVSFFVLETNALIDRNAPDRTVQLEWLDRELTASKAKWKIVYGHHNIYSDGRYGVNEVMKADVTPILKKHKIKLWINGHDHNYQRLKPIDGTTYLVCGGGGASLYKIQTNNWQEFAESVHSFGIVEVYQDQIILTGINSDSKIVDRGLIKFA